MGNRGSKKVAEASAKAVLAQKTAMKKSGLDDSSSNRYNNEMRLSPEVLKEISKWATTKSAQTKTANFPSNNEHPPPPSAAINRIELEKRLEAILKDKKRIEGYLTEEDLTAILTQIRDNPGTESCTLANQYLITETQINNLRKYVQAPKLSENNDENLRKAF